MQTYNLQGLRQKKTNRISLILICVVFIFAGFGCLFSAEQDSSDASINYYQQLREDDFQFVMLPKEQSLLVISRLVIEEVERLKVKGIALKDILLSDLIQSKHAVSEMYSSELSRLMLLVKEVRKLEEKARQNANIEVLTSLGKLKTDIDRILKEKSAAALGVQDSTDSSGRDTVVISKTKQQVVPDKDLFFNSDDLVEQWKYNRILVYEVNLARIQLIRSKIIKNYPEYQDHLFRQSIRFAYEYYNKGNFPTARLLFKDIEETYPDFVLDDIIFYRSECAYALHYFDEALRGYHRLIDHYPDSKFFPQSVSRILNIHYLLDEKDQLVEIFRLYRMQLSKTDIHTWASASYMVGNTFFKMGAFEKARTVFALIRPNTEYYYPAQYLLAACYSNLGDNESALSIYQKLLLTDNKMQQDPVLAQIRNNVFLKLGFLYYERDDHDRAMYYLDKVSDAYEHYDLSRLGLAWSAYKAGKPVLALESTEQLLKKSLVSDYQYEARVLSASAKNLLGMKEDALHDLKSAYEVSYFLDPESNTPSDRFNMPRKDPLLQGTEEEKKLLASALKIQQFLGDAASDKAEIPGQDDLATDLIRSEINELDKLAMAADTLGDRGLVSNISKIRSEMNQTLNQSRNQTTEFDPLLQKMGLREYLHYLFHALLRKTLEEKAFTKANMATARELLEEAVRAGEFSLQLQIEIRLEELKDYYAQLNQYEIWIRDNTPRKVRVDLEQWAHFSGFGISNINFSRIKAIEDRMSEFSRLISHLDHIYETKKVLFEQRIKQLLADVARIERQLDIEVSKKQEQQREAFFRQQYFDRLKKESISRLQEQVNQ